jgi:hypothetical protein
MTKVLFAVKGGGPSKLPSLVVRVLADRQAEFVGNAIVANAERCHLPDQGCHLIFNGHATSPRVVFGVAIVM